MTFKMMVINAYLDFTDYVDPIKHFIDEVHVSYLEKTRNKMANILVMKGEVALQDQIIDAGGGKDGFFALVENKQQLDDSYSPSEDTYLTINLSYDPKYYVFSREVFSLLEFLCDIGSLTQALMIIGYVVVTFFTRRLYIASVLKEMYQ